MRSQTLWKLAGVFALCLALGSTASAQYGGGGGMGGGSGTGGGTPGNTHYGYGSGKAVGIGLGAAAAAGVGIALFMRHHHKAAEASLIGCVEPGPSGISLKSETDGQTYTLASGKTDLPQGERVDVDGVLKDGSSGAPRFRVRHLVSDFGACSQTVASAQNPPNNTSSALAK